MWDVIIVGAGPGGSAAAKVCAKAGLKTLVLEKKKLPRDKVCSGLLASMAAQTLIQEIFCDFPNEVFISPYYLKGQIIYVEGATPGLVEQNMPIAWRKDLDYWMLLKAKEEGVEVLDENTVFGISDRGESYTIFVKKGRSKEELSSKFVIGADGATSAMRKLLFPGLTTPYNQEIRECYNGEFPLGRRYLHTFYDPIRKYWFLINHKENFFLLEVSGKLGETKALKERIVKPFLAKNYGFDISRSPIWVDATVEVKLHEQIISGKFTPARDNILLVGDAGGFQLPTGEGIGAALKTGMAAANAIINAIKENKRAANIYLNETKEITEFIEAIYPLAIRSRFMAADHPQTTVTAIVDMVEKSLKLKL